MTAATTTNVAVKAKRTRAKKETIVEQVQAVAEVIKAEPKVHRVTKRKEEVKAAPVVKEVQQGAAFFDLKEYIRAQKSPDVAAQMAQSVAFGIDIQLNTAMRAILKNFTAKYNEYGLESISEMYRELEVESFSETVLQEAGHEEAGPIATVIELNAVRDAWHEFAQEMTGYTFSWDGTPREYKWLSVEEMLLREVKLQVKPTTERRIAMSVKMHAAEDSGFTQEEIDAQIKKRMEREKERLRQIGETMTRQQGAIVTMYQTLGSVAGKLPQLGIDLDPYQEEAHFHQLNANIRQQLINAALRGADRSEEYATSNHNLSDSEFDAICMSVIRIKRELNAILKGPGYERARAMALAV